MTPITDEMAEAARQFLKNAYPGCPWFSHEAIRGAFMAAIRVGRAQQSGRAAAAMRQQTEQRGAGE